MWKKTCCKVIKKKDLQYEKGQEKMSHHCGCSAFIIHLVCLIIDQHNA